MKTRLLAFLVWAIVLPALAGAVVMVLWNFVCPQVFGLAALGYGQAVALFLLCQVLFGGIVFGLILLAGTMHTIGFHGNRMNHFSHRAQMLRRRWASMSEEERRRLFEGEDDWMHGAEKRRCRNCPHYTKPQEHGGQ